MKISAQMPELKISLEAMTRCGGSCAGCLMSADERAAGQLWDAAQWERIGQFVQAFIQSQQPQDFREISLNLGQGDYLLISESQATQIVTWMARVGAGQATGYLTASCVSNPAKVARMADVFHAAGQQYGQAVLFDLVLDPVKASIHHFQPVYASNIRYLRNRFGGLDLNINLGPDTVVALSPAQLIEFVQRNGFDVLTINLQPTLQSGQRFAKAWPDIQHWLTEMLDLHDAHRHGFTLNYPPILGRNKAADNGEDGWAVTFQALARRAQREIYIDHDGALSFQQAGIGDTPLGARNGFKPVLHLSEWVPADLPDMAAAAKRFAVEIAREFGRDPACVTCPHLSTCALSAVSGWRRTVLPHGPENATSACRLGLRPLMDTLERIRADGRLAACCFRSRLVQRGLLEHGYGAAESADQSTAEIYFNLPQAG